MQVEDYSEKSVVVFGETKPYYGYFKDITGGKYFPTIRDGTGGWVYSKKREAEVRDIVKKANEGALTEKPRTTYEKPTPKKETPTIFKKEVSTSSKDIVITIQCPTMNYQVLLYKTVKPSLQQKVTIKTKDETTTNVVTKINSTSEAVDDITLDNGSRVVIICGTWHVLDFKHEHEVIFE
jgi:hypothetical protein